MPRSWSSFRSWSTRNLPRPEAVSAWTSMGTRTHKRGDRGRRRTVGRIDRGGGNGGEPVRSPPVAGQSGAVNTLLIKMAATERPADEPDPSDVVEPDLEQSSSVRLKRKFKLSFSGAKHPKRHDPDLGLAATARLGQRNCIINDRPLDQELFASLDCNGDSAHAAEILTSIA